MAIEGLEPAFTDEEVTAHFKECVAIVKEIDPPEDLRGDVFRAVNAMKSNYVQRSSAIAVPAQRLVGPVQ